MELEPGPIVLDDMPLGPRVFDGARLTRHLDALVPTLSDLDGVLQAQQLEMATNTDAGFDDEFASTIGVADARTDAEFAQAGDPALGQAAERGAGAEAYRQSVLRYLPAPDTPVPDEFLPPLPNPYPPPPEPDIPQLIDDSVGRYFAQHPELAAGGAPAPAPAPPAPGPIPVPPPPPYDTHHEPTFAEVDSAYRSLLARPLALADFLAYWQHDRFWYENIRDSDEAQAYRRTGTPQR